MDTSTFPDSALKAALIQALDDLRTSCRTLASTLHLSASEIWLWHAPLSSRHAWPPDLELPTAAKGRPDDLARLRRILTALEYDDKQDTHEVRIQPALVAVTAECIELARATNAAKQRVEAAYTAMSGRFAHEWHRQRQRSEWNPLTKHAKAGAKWGRLCYAQAIRRLVVLEEKPDYIGYTWISSRELVRTTAGELLEELRQQSDETSALFNADCEALAALPDSTVLATLKTPPSYPRANILWRKDTGDQRLLRSASLPIFFPGDTLPRFRPLPPEPQPKEYRASRSDVRIEPQPFLKTRPVYRYLPAHEPDAPESQSRS